MPLLLILSCRVQHIFDENSVPGVRLVDEDVRNSSDQFAVLNDGAAGHVCVKDRTKFSTYICEFWRLV